MTFNDVNFRPVMDIRQFCPLVDIRHCLVTFGGVISCPLVDIGHCLVTLSDVNLLSSNGRYVEHNSYIIMFFKKVLFERLSPTITQDYNN